MRHLTAREYKGADCRVCGTRMQVGLTPLFPVEIPEGLAFANAIQGKKTRQPASICARCWVQRVKELFEETGDPGLFAIQLARRIAEKTRSKTSNLYFEEVLNNLEKDYRLENGLDT